MPSILGSSCPPMVTSWPAACRILFPAPVDVADISRSTVRVRAGKEGKLLFSIVSPGRPQTPTASSECFFFLSFSLATIKPPDVTCIPKVRSVEMIVHPSPTPIQAQDGHQLTLNDIFKDLFYRVELRVNHTYQRVSGCCPVLPFFA